MGEKIIKVGVKKEPGYLYYIDKDGDVARAKMIRGGKRKEAEGGNGTHSQDKIG